MSTPVSPDSEYSLAYPTGRAHANSNADSDSLGSSVSKSDRLQKAAASSGLIYERKPSIRKKIVNVFKTKK
jgi:hypothetical protein